MKLADTNRLMDKCASCGGWPCLQREGRNVRGCCMDCCETGPQWVDDWGIAIIEWNLEQRKTKKRTLPVVPLYGKTEKAKHLSKSKSKKTPKII